MKWLRILYTHTIHTVHISMTGSLVLNRAQLEIKVLVLGNLELSS